MTLDQWTAIAEILSSIAIAVTLVYLVIQTRQNASAIQASTRREHQWFQLQSGLLDRRAFEAYLSGLTVNLSHPRTRKWWEYVKYTYFDHGFVDEVSVHISNTPMSTQTGITYQTTMYGYVASMASTALSN